MAVLEPGYLVVRMIQWRLASVLSCVAVREVGMNACLMAEGCI